MAATEGIDAATHSDEEALLPVEEPESRAWTLRSPGRGPLGLVGLLTVLVVCWLATSKTPQTPRELDSLSIQGKFRQHHGRVEAVRPEEAAERNKRRARLAIEQDLTTLFWDVQGRLPPSGRAPRDKGDPTACLKSASKLFDHSVHNLELMKELDAKELLAFRRRFANAMKDDCKAMDTEQRWLAGAGKELERQKPLMTHALAKSLNEAQLGFRAEMDEWLLHESVATFEGRLGYKTLPRGQESVLKRGRKADLNESSLPENFRAEEKWPMCMEEILRIHNQGHCGSCWAFGGLASVDARMCIASNGQWNAPGDVLSRLQVTSCAPGFYYPGSDGCQGGWPHWGMEMMARQGLVSSSCLPYYISGEGSEHFEQQDTAPPCETHCQGGYGASIETDAFWARGIERYDWLVNVHGDPDKIGTMKMAIYEEGPVTFAFFANSAFMGYKAGVFSVCTGQEHANHAVYAFGWGVVPAEGEEGPVDFIEASNSWGPHWGAEGHFRIHPRCVTDVTIPGTIEGNPVNHSIAEVDSTVPLDPDNEYWPWPKPDECPVVEGCVTDIEGDQNYVASELCVSKALNKKRIRVVEFQTERGYDFVYVNGVPYSGQEGMGLDLGSLNNTLVGPEGIKFKSDISIQSSGFKLCAVE